MSDRRLVESNLLSNPFYPGSSEVVFVRARTDAQTGVVQDPDSLYPLTRDLDSSAGFNSALR